VMSGRSGSDADSPQEGVPTAAGGVAATGESGGGAGVLGVLGGFRLPVPAGFAGGIDPARLLWWGGLAAVAVVGIVEWPVALVVGAGSYVAERLCARMCAGISGEASASIRGT
jgi:hypothetical protein